MFLWWSVLSVFLSDRDVQEGIFGDDKMSCFGKWTVGCSLSEDKI